MASLSLLEEAEVAGAVAGPPVAGGATIVGEMCYAVQRCDKDIRERDVARSPVVLRWKRAPRKDIEGRKALCKRDKTDGAASPEGRCAARMKYRRDAAPAVPLTASTSLQLITCGSRQPINYRPLAWGVRGVGRDKMREV